MSSSKDPEIPIEISPQQLSSDALTGIIEHFILREGTDYGLVEVSFEKKIEQVRRQIERGEIQIMFDPESESVGLLKKEI
jgi:uncharacterized protein YheU (UPF0270 family)